MASNGKNAIANLISSLVGPLIGFVMTPFYLRIIGLEGLGLVGLMTLITTVVGVFVAGISKTYQRDLATAQVSEPEDLRGLVKGGMLLFSGLGLLLGSLVIALGQSQIRTLAIGTSFTIETLNHCLLIISVLLALGVASAAISGTLVSFRDQVWPSTLVTVVGILTAVVSWISLSRWPRVDVFYFCQLGGAILGFLVLTLRCRAILHNKTAGLASRKMGTIWGTKIQSSGRLSLVLIIHEGLGVLITQIDRILITSHFPIAALGAYNLGANPSRFVGIFTGPINIATYPDLCQLAGDGSSAKKIGEYLGRITFLLTLLFASAMIILIPSGGNMLDLWLGEAHVPKEAPLCFVLLSAGFLLLAIAGPAYNLTVAHGKVSYGILKNIFSIITLPPLGLWFIHLWGLAGVAALSIVYALICILICNWFAYNRHASIHSASLWILRCGYSLGLASILTFVLQKIHLEGLTNILASSLTALVFFFTFIIGSFGFSPKSWIYSLEIIPAKRAKELTQHPAL